MDLPNEKPSGLKPPSKIGRPCSSNLPKPAIPQSPKTNGDTSIVRKLSNDNMAKKKLIDVDDGLMELALGRRLSIDRKSSQGSDSLWADVRKLSEAGIRRASDSSIVLTEDTDSFIIGDRVWVGGSKPGHIAYIGETQFAPGDWAGIVLDEPIGKNDGSVAGFRYFQCESRKGIFSRLTRLSRKPLMTNEDEQITPRSSPPGTTTVSPGSSVSRITSPVSPTGSITMPVLHTGSRGGSEMKVGDRVIVMNSNAGSKAGMLRFIGTTQFAPGQWCGVELDDPLGKNDGSVEGVRYFECQNKFGLFAPLHKVSLSPTSSRRPSCAMHHSSSGLKKFGSKESISSVASTTSMKSAARKPPSHSAMTTPTVPKRNPLQDVIKEKDIYIEQLLKERDIEKSEGVRAASRVEASDHKFDVLNQEFIQYREEAEARQIDMQAFVKHLQDQNKNLTGLLEDEKKRSEDLQFRFEEESINKSEMEQKTPLDLQLSNQTLNQRLAELEQSLKDERVRIEELEKDSNKLFEAEETITKLRVIQEETDEKLSHLQASNEVTDKFVEQLKEDMDLKNVLLEETMSVKRKQEEEIMQLNSAIETSKVLVAQRQGEIIYKHNLEINKLNKILGDYESKMKENELKEEYLIQELNALKTSSSKIVEELKKCHEQELEKLHKLLTESEQTKKNMANSLKTANLELEAMKHLLEKERLEANAKVENMMEKLKQLEETYSEKEEEIVNLNEKLSKLETLIKTKDEESKGIKECAVGTEAHLKKEIDKLLNEFKIKEKEFVNIIEEDKKTLLNSTNSHEELILKMKKEIEVVNMKLIGTENELNNVRSFMELKQEEYNNVLKEKEEKYVELKNAFENTKVEFLAQIENVNKELSESRNTVKENEIKISKLMKELEDQKSVSLQNSEEMNRCHGKELERLQQLLTETDLKAKNYENCFKSENIEFNEIKSMLQKENEDAKNKITNLTKEVSLFEEKFVKKEEEIVNFHKKLLDMENMIKLKDEECLNFKKSSNEIESTLKKQLEDLESKMKCYQNEFKLKEQSLLSERDETIKMLEKVQNECLQLQNKSHEFETNIQENKDKMNLIGKENESKISSLNNEFELMKKEYETVVKEKDDMIKELINKNNLEITDQQMELNKKCLEYENQFKHKEDVIVNLRKELEQNKTYTENLRTELEESKTLSLSSSEEIKTHFSNEINSLGKMLAESELKAKNYENDLENKTKEIDNLKTSFQKETEDALSKLTKLEKQLSSSTDSLNKNKKEIVDLNEKISRMENTMQLKDDEIIGLQESPIKVANSFKKEIENIQNQFKIKEDECKNKENMFTKTVNDLKTDIEKEKTKFIELEIKNKQLERDLKEKLNQVDTHLKEKEKLSSALNTLESNKTDQDKLLKEGQGNFIETKNELEKSKLEIVEQHKVLQDLRQRLSENDQRFNSQRQLVGQQEQDILVLKANSESCQKQISNLSFEVTDWRNKFKNSEEKCSLLNQQKLNLEKDLETLRNNMSSHVGVQQQIPIKNESINNGNDEDVNYQMQIDFMNSIIVDLQHEKEALTSRIHYLETGELSGATNGNGSEGQITLRLYCEICEVFDAHETDDCPRQAMDSPPPQQPHKPSPRGYQRPYCENCEQFGHNTGDCDDLTF